MALVVNWDRTAVDLWHEIIWNFQENPCHIFTEAEKYGERHIGHSLRSWPMLLSCHLYYLQETPNFLSFRAITLTVFTIFKIWLQIQIYDKILMWKHVSYDLWQKKFKIFMFSRHKIFNFQNFQNLTSFLESVSQLDHIWCITRHVWKNFEKVRFYPLRGPKWPNPRRLPLQQKLFSD